MSSSSDGAPVFTFEEELASIIAAVMPVVRGARTCAELAQAIADNMADWRDSPDPTQRARLEAILTAAEDGERAHGAAVHALNILKVQEGHANMAYLLNGIATATAHATRALARAIDASKSEYDDEPAAG